MSTTLAPCSTTHSNSLQALATIPGVMIGVDDFEPADIDSTVYG